MQTIINFDQLEGILGTVQDKLLADHTALTAHVSNAIAHITSDERTKWNAYDGSISGLDSSVNTNRQLIQSHTGDTNVHTNATEKSKWNTNSVHVLTHSKSGTVHTLSGLGGLTGLLACVFKSTAAFTTGDTFTVDGVTGYAAQLISGETAETNLFTNNTTVMVVIDTAGKKVNFKKAGTRKIPAGTELLRTSTSATFTVPEDGNYEVFVVAPGGYGGDGYTTMIYHPSIGSYPNGYYNSGQGGGPGGAAKGTFNLKKGETYQCTASYTGSFGSLMTATQGSRGGVGTAGTDGVEGVPGTAKGGSINITGYSGYAGTYNQTKDAPGATGGGYNSNISNIPMVTRRTGLKGGNSGSSINPETPTDTTYGVGGGGGAAQTGRNGGRGGYGLVVVRRA